MTNYFSNPNIILVSSASTLLNNVSLPVSNSFTQSLTVDVRDYNGCTFYITVTTGSGAGSQAAIFIESTYVGGTNFFTKSLQDGSSITYGTGSAATTIARNKLPIYTSGSATGSISVDVNCARDSQLRVQAQDTGTVSNPGRITVVAVASRT